MKFGQLLGLSAAIMLFATSGLAFADEGGDPAQGKKVFKKCKACHTLEEGKNKIGPSLYGVFGRTSGTLEGFNFSDAIIEAAIVWDEETLDQYLTKPKDMIPGGKMAFPGLKKEQARKDVIAYIKQETEMSAASSGSDREALIKDALSAAHSEISNGATVMDWEGNVLQEGTNGWVCYPTPPEADAICPMCLDQPWLEWVEAWVNEEDFETSRVGMAYMLAGDCGVSNIDPFATELTEDNQWVTEGPHLMILVPDPAALEGLSTDPYTGEPYVMWKDTPYVHIMVPVAGE